MFKTFVLISFFYTTLLFSQNYFPPKTGGQWDTMSPNRLGWCNDSINKMYDFLESKNSKSIIVLKDGKIVLEKYFGNFTKDSFWYWASAGKTVTSALIGIAQQEGLLKLSDSSSKYLGQNWSSCTPQQEGKITIKNHLTMTTGLDENNPDQDCKSPSCLKYKADAGTRWYYYNAPYLLLQDVVANASGISFQQYTNTRLMSKIGMSGLWVNGVFYSKPRDMAKFGLMILNKGIWNTDSIIKDQNYYQEMVNTSQNLNLSYGYLFWLNGKAKSMLPQSSIVFNQSLFPKAPVDLFAALGKNDQKIYVIPSQNMVVIRMGNSAGPTSFGPSGFDNQFLDQLMNLSCNNSSQIKDFNSNNHFKISPNPINHQDLTIESQKETNFQIINQMGQMICSGHLNIGNNQVVIKLVPGLYFVKIENTFQKLIVE